MEYYINEELSVYDNLKCECRGPTCKRCDSLTAMCGILIRYQNNEESRRLCFEYIIACDSSKGRMYTANEQRVPLERRLSNINISACIKCERLQFPLVVLSIWLNSDVCSILNWFTMCHTSRIITPYSIRFIVTRTVYSHSYTDLQVFL